MKHSDIKAFAEIQSFTRVQYIRFIHDHIKKNDRLSCEHSFLLHIINEIISNVIAAEGMKSIVALDNISP